MLMMDFAAFLLLLMGIFGFVRSVLDLKPGGRSARTRKSK